MLPTSNIREIVQRLRTSAPTLAKAADLGVARLLAHVRERVLRDTQAQKVMDPDLGVIELTPLETLLTHSALLGRLRAFQLAPAVAYIYPGYNHSKFDFSLSSLGWGTRALKALLSQEIERKFAPDAHEVEAVRLALLLKQIAAAPFATAWWSLIEETRRDEFMSAAAFLTREFRSVRHPIAEEVCAALMILSDPFLELLTRWFEDREHAERFSLSIVALQLGSALDMRLSYLADLVVGPLSAPRIADVVVGSRASGIPGGFDVERLLHTLAPIHLTAPSAPYSHADGETVLGVDERGIQPLESFAIQGAMLRARVFDHPKVRLIRHMATRLAAEWGTERRHPLDVTDAIESHGDQAWLFDIHQNPEIQEGSRARRLAERLRTRVLPKATLSFGPAYMAGANLLEAADAADHRAMVMREVQRAFGDRKRVAEIERSISEGARPRTNDSGLDRDMPEIFVDFPAPNWTGAERVLVRTRSGEIEVASNHFAVFGWSELYMSSKWAGRVYCDPEIAQDVDRSARRVFAREFGLELNDKAGIHRSQGFAGARKRDPDSGPPDYFARKPPKPKRGVSRGGLYIRPEDLKLPSLWQTSSAIARDRLARRLRAARQQGYSPIAKGALIRLIDAITSFQAMVYEGGSLQAIQPGEERRLQQIFRDHLRSREFRVQEGLKVAGGEVDLLFEDEVVIEMKIYPRPTDNPTAVGAAFALQARRYALAIDKDIVATFVGYQPRSEMGHRPAADLLDVVRMSDRTVQVRAWVPVGFPLPSRVRARPSPRQRKTN